MPGIWSWMAICWWHTSGMRFWTLLRFAIAGLFESVQVYSEGGLDMANQVSQETDLFKSIKFYSKDGLKWLIYTWIMVLKWLLNGDTGKRQGLFIVQVSQDRVHWVDRIVLRRWSCNSYLPAMLEMILYIFIVQVSWDTEVFELVKFYLGDGCEMHSLFRSLSVSRVYSGDGLEMAVHQ